MSAAHVDEIVNGCSVLAGALDVAAGYIVGQKADAIAVLVGPAASFIADQGAAVATAGIAEAAVPVIVAAAERVVKSLSEVTPRRCGRAAPRSPAASWASDSDGRG
jgi:hypothetical protein